MTHSLAAGRAVATGRRLADCFQSDRRLFFRAVLWRCALPALKHVVALPVLVRFMCATPSQTADSQQLRRRIDAIRHLLAKGGRLVISGNCLERSLVLYRLLSEVGASPQLVMGVHRKNAAVAGHAWVEVNGEALADTTTSGFVPVLVFEGTGQARTIGGPTTRASSARSG